MALGYRHGCWEQHLLVCGPSVKVEQRVASGRVFFFLIGNDLSTKSNQSILRIKRTFWTHFCHSKAASSRPLRMNFEGINLLPCLKLPGEATRVSTSKTWILDNGRSGKALGVSFFWVQDWWWIWWDFDGFWMGFGWDFDGILMDFCWDSCWESVGWQLVSFTTYHDTCRMELKLSIKVSHC